MDRSGNDRRSVWFRQNRRGGKFNSYCVATARTLQVFTSICWVGMMDPETARTYYGKHGPEQFSEVSDIVPRSN